MYNIIPASEMHKATVVNINGKLQEALAEQMKRIQAAASRGDNHCEWIFYDNFRYEQFEKDAEEAFIINGGYTLRSVGIFGGVMQRSKYICW